MVEKALRVTAYAVTLFIISIPCPCADISTSALIGYFTGIPTLSDSFTGLTAHQEHPAACALERRPYIEFDGNRHEILRNLQGSGGTIANGLASIGVYYPLAKDRAGCLVSYLDNYKANSWPFLEDNFHAATSYDTGRASVTLFTSGPRLFRTGITIGKQIRGDGDGLLYLFEIAGALPYGLSGTARYCTIPYDGGFDVSYESVTKLLPWHFSHTGYEGNLSWRLPKEFILSAALARKSIATPGNFRGHSHQHAQVWEGDGNAWSVKVEKRGFRGVDASISYGRDDLSGELGLWYNESHYLRSFIRGDIHRLSLETVFPEQSPLVPSFRYDTVSTDGVLSHGIVDSWPFTPRQMELIGDKTWTFSGTGSIVSHAGTFTWFVRPEYRWKLSFARAYLDYYLRIRTRDHLSANIMDMLFGELRTETSRIQYYDFALVAFERSLSWDRYAFEIAVSQLVPLRHRKIGVSGKTSVSSSLPRMELTKPKRFGGFSIIGNMKLFL